MNNDIKQLNEAYQDIRLKPKQSVEEAGPSTNKSIVLASLKGITLSAVEKTSGSSQMTIMYKNNYGDHEIGFIEQKAGGIDVHRVVRGGGFSGRVPGADLNSELGRLRLGNAILCMILADTEEVAAGDN